MVAAIPMVLLYFIPGFIGIWCFCSLQEIKLIEHYIVFSLAFSYLLAYFGSNPIINVAVAIFIAVVIHFILKNVSVKTALKDGFAYSPARSIWDDLLDTESGTYIIVQLNSDTHYYSGVYCRKSQDKDEGLFAISNFTEYDDRNEVVDKQPSHIIVFHISDIKSIIVGYPTNSEVKDYLIPSDNDDN
nr:MAG TPA: hypothetical protein [Caudoviricetes sp.]